MEEATRRGKEVVDISGEFDPEQIGRDLPKGFLLGSATSAYQIEGASTADGKGLSIWDTWAAGGKTDGGVTGDVACDHYNHWDKDCEMMHRMGLRAYRFSISWARIIPKGRGEVNQSGVQFYRKLIERLQSHKIEPWVTLYHWDLPQALQDELGGWLSPEMPAVFAQYARTCFIEFGDIVKEWATFNEPYVTSYYGYGVAQSPPGISGQKLRVAHTILLSHGLVHSLYEREFKHIQQGRVGIVLNCAWRSPADPSSEIDIDAALRSVDQRLGWFAEPLRSGNYPECMKDELDRAGILFTEQEKLMVSGSADFLGNYYTTKYVTRGDTGAPVEVPAPQSARTLGANCLGWIVVPSGLQSLLKRLSEMFPDKDIYVTENGYADSGTQTDVLVNDTARIDYLARHLREVSRCIHNGVNVRGYFAWSLMDNLEWNHGYVPRFGLVHIDFDSQERTRTLKASAKWFSKVIAAN